MRHEETRPEVLIVGYGNPLRSDDGVGWHVAQKLYDMPLGPRVQVEACHQLMPELIEDLFHVKLIVFVDASATDAAGVIACRTKLRDCKEPQPFTHELTPDCLMCFAYKQFRVAPCAVVYTVGGLSFAYGERLSIPVTRAVDEIVNRIHRLVGWWGCTGTTCAEAFEEAVSQA